MTYRNYLIDLEMQLWIGTGRIPLKCWKHSVQMKGANQWDETNTSKTLIAKMKRNVCILAVANFSASLTHWGRVPHLCVSKLTNIGSDNGLSPRRRQAIIWTNAAILLIRPLGTNVREKINSNVHIFMQENAFENIVWERVAILSQPQYVIIPSIWTMLLWQIH